MGNCLKTQLKEVVNNNNLEKLGYLSVETTQMDASSFNIATNGRLSINCASGKTVHIKINGDGWFVRNISDAGDVTKHEIEGDVLYNAYNDNNLYFSNGTYTILINEKYNIATINYYSDGVSIFSFDGNSLKYSPLTSIIWNGDNVKCKISSISNMNGLSEFIASGASNITGTLSQLPNSPLYRFNNQAGKITGNLSDFSKFSSTMRIIEITGNYGITGLFEDLGTLTSLTDVSTANTSINGSVDNFVSAQYDAGRTTCSDGIASAHLLKNVRFGGNLYTSEDTGQYLYWESKEKIYILTVSKTNPTKIYCKGYTQSEAETKWPGKTIVRVDE